MNSNSYFLFPHRYRLVDQVPWKSGPSQKDQLVVFLCRERQYSDRFEPHTFDYSFYDILLGSQEVLSLTPDEDSQWQTLFSIAFEDQGEDMNFREINFKTKAASSDLSVFAQHLEYLKAFVEGKEKIKSWFVWLDENRDEFQNNLTDTELTHLSIEGYSEAQKILSHLGVSFNPSPRYGWVGMDRQSWTGARPERKIKRLPG